MKYRLRIAKCELGIREFGSRAVWPGSGKSRGPAGTRHLGPGTFLENRTSRLMGKAVPMPFSRTERLWCHFQVCAIGRFAIRNSPFVWVVLGVLILGLAGCAPHVIVLHDPLPAEAHNDLALRYMEEGAWKAAERALRRASRKAPGWAVPYMNLGFLYARQGRWSDAFRAYARAVRLDGTCADCLNNLAWSALRSGKRQSLAAAWVRRAIALGGPEGFRYRHTAAWVEYLRGDCAAAFQEMATALAEAPLSEGFLYAMDADRMRRMCSP